VRINAGNDCLTIFDLTIESLVSFVCRLHQLQGLVWRS
jgi:hypothetical protein